jgi:hypothetical protein
MRSNVVSAALPIMIESPAPGQNIYDEAIFISGSVDLGDRDSASFQVRNRDRRP